MVNLLSELIAASVVRTSLNNLNETFLALLVSASCKPSSCVIGADKSQFCRYIFFADLVLHVRQGLGHRSRIALPGITHLLWLIGADEKLCIGMRIVWRMDFYQSLNRAYHIKFCWFSIDCAFDRITVVFNHDDCPWLHNRAQIAGE